MATYDDGAYNDDLTGPSDGLRYAAEMENQRKRGLINQMPGIHNFNENSNGQAPTGDLAQHLLDNPNDPYGYARDVSRQVNAETGGVNSLADISQYQLGGDPNYAARHSEFQLGAAGDVLNRQGPQVAGSTIEPWQAGQMSAAGQLGSQANSLNSLANSQAAFGVMPTGPSVAELAMKQQGDAAQRQQMSMAAGARGGGSALALQNAAANSAGIAGTMNQNLGIQRAQEDMQNRQFALGALGAAAGTRSAAGGLTAQQANVYGQGGQLKGQLDFQIGDANARYQANQNALNDAASMDRTRLGYQLQEKQLDSNQRYDDQRTGKHLQAYGIARGNEDKTGQGTFSGSRGGDTLWGAAANAGGSFFSSLSDARAKTKIAPAGEQISDAFRAADRSAADITNTRVDYPGGSPPSALQQFAFSNPPNRSIRREDPYPPALNAPGYGYEYKDPSAPGAAPGEHYGPMAQDLEKTPAGASTVIEGKDGKKAIDTGRLALVNASETAKQRKELDELRSIVKKHDSAFAAPTAYPGGYGY